MYCKKCGCKIYTGEEKCSNCGNDTNDIEYSGGFWGLVGEQENKTKEFDIGNDSVLSTDLKIHENEKTNDELIVVPEKDIKLEKKNMVLLKLLLGIIVILLFACIVQTLHVSWLNKKYREYNSEYEVLEKEHQNLASDYGELDLGLFRNYNPIMNQYENEGSDKKVMDKKYGFNLVLDLG